MNISRDILLTLGYFDTFSYPLRKREIFIFLPNNYTSDIFEEGLRLLIADGLVFHISDLYCLRNNYDIIQRRLKGNGMAKDLMKTAQKVSAFISLFPFVRGVAVSGSLSKNYADEHSDIDLFIICSTNRLWIARTLLHCFKKLTFLFNKEHYFCMNYFIDESALEIPEKNIYTAIEITTVLPLHGSVIFQQFFAANNWTIGFLPNNYLRVSSAREPRGGFFKKAAEFLLNLAAGYRIDNWLMKVTTSRWRKKYLRKKLNSRGILLSMAASKHSAKPDPKEFQDKIVANYTAKSSEFEVMLQEKVMINPLH